MREEKFRCHPSVIVEKLWGIIAFVFFIAITNIEDLKDIASTGVFSDVFIVFGDVLIILALILAYNTIVWYKTLISIEENTIVIQRKTISSKVNTYGIKNISNVNLEQNIFERLIGTYKIKIDTDSLSTANSTDIEIILSKEQAYEFKNTVLKLMNSNKSKSVNENEENKNYNLENHNFYQEEEIDYDIIYSTKDVLKHCFYNLSTVGIIFNVSIIAFTIFVSARTDDLEGIITTAILIISSGASLIKLFLGDLFKYYKFSIKRNEDKLYISYGMLNRRKYTVPISRINAINIKQTLISRVCKRYSLDLVTIGIGDDDSEGAQILLASKKDVFMKNMILLLPELSMRGDVVLKKEPKKKILMDIVKIVIESIAIGILLLLILKIDKSISAKILLCIFLVVIILLVLIVYFSYITRGCYLGKENIIISRGIFNKKISIMKYKKIQYMNVKETPLSRALKLCRGEVHILASLGNDVNHIGYYDVELFENIKEKIIDYNIIKT